MNIQSLVPNLTRFADPGQIGAELLQLGPTTAGGFLLPDVLPCHVFLIISEKQ